MVADRRITVDIVGDATRFTKATKDAQSSASKFGNSLKKGLGIGAGIGMFSMLTGAIGTTIDFLGDAVKAAMEEQASISRLTTSLRANVPAWDGNTASIERNIKAKMDLGFTDEEQRDSMALLVVATKNVTKAETIMATAMDLARLKGISLADASSALIKIEGGQFRALKALGIVLKEGATQTEALAAVQAAAAGQAEAYAKTTEGKLLVAQTKLGDKMDELGMVIIPVLNTALDGLFRVMDELDRLIVRIDWDKVALFFPQVAPLIDKFSGSTRNATTELMKIKAAMTIVRVTGAILSQGTRDLQVSISESVRRIHRSWAWLAGEMLGKFNTDYDRAMDIRDARTRLSTAVTNDEKVKAYADLAELGVLSNRDFQNWGSILDRMIAGTTGAVHEALVQAKIDYQRYRAYIQQPIDVTVHYHGGGAGGVKQAATGGPRSGFTWVGEEGPELVNLPRGSYVNTAAKSRRMGGGGGIVVNVAGSIIGPSGVDELMDMMARRLRLDGV